MTDKEKIINLIKQNKDKLEKKYGFKNIFLYGSFAKGQASKNSDVDLAVKVEDDSFKTWDNFLGAKDELKGLLGKEIDLVYLDSVNPIIKDEIEKDHISIG